MNSSSIKPRLVVRYHPGVEGIVHAKKPVPAQDWIDDQINVTEIKRLGPTEWWAVLPFTGGYFLAPGPLLTILRDATYEDFLSAAETANVPGRKTLAELFPDYLKQLLTARRLKQIFGTPWDEC